MVGTEHRPMLAAVAMCAVMLTSSGCSTASDAGAAPAAGDASAEARVARGKTLVTVGGCHDCHTPKKMGPMGPEPDMSRMLMGHPEADGAAPAYKPADGSPWIVATTGDLTQWSGPWGLSYPANLTPDTNTGLRSGVWTEDLFIQAMRSGKHMGTARDILPPMPWQMIGQLGDEDLKAIWAYLGTIPAINNHVPDPVPPAAP
ncbi:MAG: diheme cytochrome c-553 [Vicinamibacterales bacterium]